MATTLVLKGKIEYCEAHNIIIYYGEECFTINLEDTKILIDKKIKPTVLLIWCTDPIHSHYTGEYLYLMPEGYLYLTNHEIKEEDTYKSYQRSLHQRS